MSQSPARCVIPAQDAGTNVSVNESLAHGLVTRLMREAEDSTERLNLAINLRSTCKRAAMYRAKRDLLRRAVPELLRGAEFDADPSGKNKAGFYTIDHWGCGTVSTVAGRKPAVRAGSLVLSKSFVSPRNLQCGTLVLASVSRHAVMRLFQRLRTTDQREVLRELSDFARLAGENVSVFQQLGIDALLLIPTARGAFVVVVDNVYAELLTIKTWISDARLEEEPKRLQAVQRARCEGGYVMDDGAYYPVISAVALQRLFGEDASLANWHQLNQLCDATRPPGTPLVSGMRFLSTEERLQRFRERYGSPAREESTAAMVLQSAIRRD
jgi:hypothetical protein